MRQSASHSADFRCAKLPGLNAHFTFVMFSNETTSEIENDYKALKSEEYDLSKLVEWGESALKNGTGPAASLIACQAGTLFHLCDLGLSFQEGYNAARKVLQQGFCYKNLMRHIDNLF